LHFYHALMASIRAHILDGDFETFYEKQRDALVRQDEERPPKPMPKPRVPRNFEARGVYTLRKSREGFFSIKHSSGEVMHPGADPNVEAERLYVAQSRLIDRISTHEDSALVVWDVGLGAAHNAMAAIRAYEALCVKQETPSRGLRIISFENDLDSLRLALMNVTRFDHLKHKAPNLLLREGAWRPKHVPIIWELCEGDFLANISLAQKPDLIFYDPFSYKTNQDLWTLDAFQAIFDHCQYSDTELYSYTASTRIRATMLAAGFFVARGFSSGQKLETTLAMTQTALERKRVANQIPDLLSRAWLDRWERSDARLPLNLSPTREETFELTIRSHAQFATNGGP